MIINSLNVYGFGKLKDLQIQLTEGINLIEGHNEAGKSTLMAFMRAIFFGFETRRSLHLRYEPIDGGKFGGSIDLLDENGEKYRIERIFISKISGDVKVYLPNDEIKGEEYLPILLGKINEQVYKQIFSFGLTELQQIEALENEQINDFIYHASTGSVNQILKMKDSLDMKQQQLYRASGRKPEINILVTELDEIARQIEQLRNRNKQHETFITRIDELAKNIAKVDDEIEASKTEFNWYEKLKNQHKQYLRLREIDEELKNYPQDFVFPTSGVERINNLIQSIDSLELELNHLLKKRDEFEQKLTQLEDNHIYEENEGLIISLKEDLNKYKDLQLRYKSLDNDLENIETKANEALSQLGSSFDKEKILSLEFTLRDKQYLQELLTKLQQKEKDLQDLEKELELKYTRLNQVKKAKNDIFQNTTERQASNNIGTIYPRIQKSWVAMKEREWKLNQLLEQKKALEGFKPNNSSNTPLLLFNGLISIAGVILLFTDFRAYGGMILFFSLSIILLSFVTKQSKKPNRVMKQNFYQLDQQIDRLKVELDQLNADVLNQLSDLGISRFDEQVITDLEKQFNYFQKSELKLEELQARIVDYNKEIGLLEVEINGLEQKQDEAIGEHNSLKASWNNWLGEHKLEADLSYVIVFDIMALIQATKEQIKKASQIKNDKEIILPLLEEYRRKITILGDILQHEAYLSDEELIYLAFDGLRKQKELKTEKKHLSNVFNDLTDQLANLNTKLTLEKAKYNDLLNYTKVSKLEEFYSKGNEFSRYKQLNLEKQHLVASIKSICSSEDEFANLLNHYVTYSIDEINLSIEKISQKLRIDSETIRQLSEEKGSLQNQLKQMEDDNSLSELNQQYAMKQAELTLKIKEYLTASLGKHILEKTMKVYETEKQPKVIQIASEYFKIITNGNYTRIIKSIDTQRIEVERADGKRFEPQFLSRGTIEQLFLVMRFAIIEEFSKDIHLPIILDDIFVNFDLNRFKNTIGVLEKMAKRYQIIIFTCHEHVTYQLNNHSPLNQVYLKHEQPIEV